MDTRADLPAPAPAPVSGAPADEPQERLAGLAGVVAAAMALGVTELVSGFSDQDQSLVVSVGNGVVDRSPEPITRFGIDTFGTGDKPALVLGIDAVITLVTERRKRAIELPATVVAVEPTLVGAVVGAVKLPGGTLATRGESPVPLPLVTRRKQRARHHHYHRRSHRQDRHRTYHRWRLSGVGDS